MSVKLLTEHHLEILSLKVGCTGWSESTLVKMPHCWKSHVTAQLCHFSNGINSIVNLQIAGEHGECGPHKLDPSGFLYNPQTFMEQGSMYSNTCL